MRANLKTSTLDSHTSSPSDERNIWHFSIFYVICLISFIHCSRHLIHGSEVAYVTRIVLFATRNLARYISTVRNTIHVELQMIYRIIYFWSCPSKMNYNNNYYMKVKKRRYFKYALHKFYLEIKNNCRLWKKSKAKDFVIISFHSQNSRHIRIIIHVAL